MAEMLSPNTRRRRARETRRPSVVADSVELESYTVITHLVTDEDCAYTQRSGGVKTLSTSKISQLVEDCCIAHLRKTSDMPTAGCAVNLRHLAPMPVKSTVGVRVTVANRIRRQIAFAFEVYDDADHSHQVAAGTHQRAFVELDTLQQNLAAKQPEPKLEVGLTGMSHHFVDSMHLGGEAEFGGEISALSTSALMTWAEEATIAAVEAHLPDGYTTVGGQTTIAHVAPTPRGLQVTCKAKLTKIESTKSGKQKLLFEVVAEDLKQPVMTGTHLRFVVERDSFEKKAEGIALPDGRRRGSKGGEEEDIAAMEAAMANAQIGSDELDIDTC